MCGIETLQSSSLPFLLTPPCSHKQVQASLGGLLKAIDLAVSLDCHQGGHSTEHHGWAAKLAKTYKEKVASAPSFETNVVPGLSYEGKISAAPSFEANTLPAQLFEESENTTPDPTAAALTVTFIKVPGSSAFTSDIYYYRRSGSCSQGDLMLRGYGVLV